MVVHALGFLYFRRGKLDEAMQTFDQALVELSDALGPRGPLTLEVVRNIGILNSKRSDRVSEEQSPDIKPRTEQVQNQSEGSIDAFQISPSEIFAPPLFSNTKDSRRSGKL